MFLADLFFGAAKADLAGTRHWDPNASIFFTERKMKTEKGEDRRNDKAEKNKDMKHEAVC